MIFLILMALLGVILGIGLGYLLRKKLAQAQANSLEAKAEKILNEAKLKQQEALLQARDKAFKIIDDAKKEEETIKQELRAEKQRLEKRENVFDQKLLEIESERQKLQTQTEKITTIKTELEVRREEAIKKLEALARLNREQAKDELLARVEVKIKEDLMNRVLKLEKESSEYYETKAKNIILSAMQRYAGSHSSENTTTLVDLPNDEMKGRIIGKEGRNIKTIEKLTGCELIVDETPNVITISGFSPVRRQVARLALEKLIADGRIQPARIEEFVEAAKVDLSTDIRKAGEEAVHQLGFTGLDPKLVQIVGRLKYRTSYGQNVLLHSIEVAQVAGIMAAELGLDVTLAKKCGFFHDIGKAVDHDTQGSHPQIGYQIMKKFGFDEEIAYACIGHHEDKPIYLSSVIAKAADAVSGARFGARRDTYEQYINRLEDLEKVASSFPGIDKVYAIAAGREVRVFVKPEETDDLSAHNLAREVAKKIEQELQYPGEIRVTVIREKRVIEYAR